MKTNVWQKFEPHEATQQLCVHLICGAREAHTWQLGKNPKDWWRGIHVTFRKETRKFIQINHFTNSLDLSQNLSQFLFDVSVRSMGGNLSGDDYFLYASVNGELGIFKLMEESFPQPTSVIMASCDGLICYRSRRTRHVEVLEIVVWNAMTQERLPWDLLTVMLVTSLDWLSTHLVLQQRWCLALKWSAFSVQI